MNHLKKTAAGSLVLTLAFFAGSFCLHPMSAQAMDAASAMAMGGHALNDGSDAVIGDDVPVTAWNICVVNCASQAPQAVAAKKFSVDFFANLFLGVSYDRDPRLLPIASEPDISGTHPPSPDILFSVFKKE